MRTKEPKKIAAYHHRIPSEHEPFCDPEPGQYFVSAKDGDQYWLMLGPFPTHRKALDQVDNVRSFCIEHDARSVWKAFGTMRMKEECTQLGSANQYFPGLFKKAKHRR